MENNSKHKTKAADAPGAGAADRAIFVERGKRGSPPGSMSSVRTAASGTTHEHSASLSNTGCRRSPCCAHFVAPRKPARAAEQRARAPRAPRTPNCATSGAASARSAATCVSARSHSRSKSGAATRAHGGESAPNAARRCTATARRAVGVTAALSAHT